MRQWKLEMQGEYEKFHRNSSYNIEQFYLALEKISKSHFADKSMNDGDSFTFALTNGSQCKFIFNKDITEISQISIDGEQFSLLKKDDFTNTKQYKSMQSMALKTIGTGLRATNDHIGEKFPEKMIKALKALTPGAIISFTGGKSYVCTQRPSENVIKLVQAYSGDIKNLTLDSLKNPQQLSINTLDDIQLQRFYRNNQKQMTQRMEFNVSFTNRAKEFVDLVERNVKLNEPHRINMGNITVIAKKNRDGSVSWFDGQGNGVQKKDIVLMNAILNCGINERNYIRNNPTNMEIARDVNFEKEMENLSMGRKFSNMYHQMLQYVQENKTNLAIESFQYEKSGKNFTPARIVFAERDGLVKAVKVTYKDNDFSKGEDKITELSEAEFVNLCKQIYTENHRVLATRTEELLLNKIRQKKKEMTPEQRQEIDNYIEDIIENKVKIINTQMEETSKIDVISLVQGYMQEQNPKEISVKTIIDEMER